ncbi:hypothetical protein ALT_8897 [Aspergillus lentulus]|uniref:gamma-glutamylcyclotransferase n=1 Tax=Aspergillus lentulus TaxID=293939 RepID=A0AAN4PSY0_ASPLE|nr:uncharacterized protein IFM58399_04258 [Aspergillus lentulus]GAQ11576.1 hypothetical protein ALT_8897 [Aspergillus lentulus]GFF35557.1 hypothetical protein IFM58399_04258 [Aspergillus lentulus]GFF60326.1 hypothetical protein IFM62136_04555 [Aspergillus lentulus]GFF72157.1 hypothetical protein IFM47457_03067 [Aspergillus lentulus]GFF75006.1 hypothetical protein IFM60648_04336 [Aspergillus lentulus]
MTIQLPTSDGEADPGATSPSKFNALQTFRRLWELVSPARLEDISYRETDCHPPKTPVRRRRQSIADQSLDRDEHLAEKVTSHQIEDTVPPEKTVLYLAYGSNLCAKTFLGKRGIRPLSQINVVVPSLQLTFDMPGIPYLEPCFAATRRHAHPSKETETGEVGNNQSPADADTFEQSTLLSEDSTSMPLVGVVYEVTITDYAKIIATEGGGGGYKDIVVDCYPFPKPHSPTDPIPEHPETKPFKAHTLLSPNEDPDPSHLTAKDHKLPSPYRRPKSCYAQPSARYLDLINTGAAEHNLPLAYRRYLSQFQPYRITTVRQTIGKAIFVASWIPPLIIILSLSKLLAGPDGRSPPWLVWGSNLLFYIMWSTYDLFFAPIFGDGERTMEDTRS